MSALRQRCVGYGGFGDPETEINVSKGELRYKKSVTEDRIRYQGEAGDVGYGDDKFRKRSGEIKEREVRMHCEDEFMDNKSDSWSSDGVGLRKSRSCGRGDDREPGELSGESGSDGGVVLDSQVKEDGIKKKIERGNGSPDKAKKRKCSSGSHYRDEKEVSSMMKNRDSNVVSTLPPSSTLPRPSKIAKILDPDSAKSSLDMKESIIEDEDITPLRDIRSSRWVNDLDSPAAGEISKDEVIHKLGELKREGSSGVGSKSSDSDERVWSSGRDSCSGHVTDNNDMEEDEDNHYDGGSASPSDTELEDDPRLSSSPRRNVNMLHGCRSVDEFERLNKINEGTYGIVYKARDKKTGELVALKKVKMEKEREGFPLTALREINILLSFNHSSIVEVKEIVVGSSFDDIFMVMEYMEHDLKGFLDSRKQPFSETEVKSLMLQLLKGTKYLHDNWVLHRDLKTSNLLLNNQLDLKICDFGLARQYGSPLKPYTQLVVTLWYRAPELLLGAKQYSTAIDMWSVGCIMAELLSKGPLFNGKSELDQIYKIFRTLGTPNDTIWPGFSELPGAKGNFVKHQCNILRKKFPPNSFKGAPVLSDAGFDLLSKLLTYDPERRISAEAALEHEWFQEVPCSNDKELPHTLFDVIEQDRRMRRITKGPNTVEGRQWRELQGWGSSNGGVFG